MYQIGSRKEDGEVKLHSIHAESVYSIKHPDLGVDVLGVSSLFDQYIRPISTSH